MSRKVVTGASLIGGAGLGALLMYLLDPEVGNKRRQKISHAATDAMHDAGHTLSHAVSELSEKAGDLRQKIHDHAHELADRATHHIDSAHDSAQSSVMSLSDRLRDQAHRLSDAISRRAADAASGANDYRDTARRYVENARAYARKRVGAKRGGISATGAGVGAAGALAIGVTAMFLLDPVQGRRRRQVVGKSVSEAVCAAGSTCHTAGQFLRNQLDRMFSSHQSGAEQPGLDQWEKEHQQFPPAVASAGEPAR